jgi:hypothetical protein
VLIILELELVPQGSASSCSVKLGQNYFMLSPRTEHDKREKVLKYVENLENYREVQVYR